MRHRGKILLAVLTGLVLYTAVQASRLLPRLSGSQLGAATGAIFAVMLGWQLLYHSRPHLIRSRLFTAFAWTGAVACGAWATFVLLSMPFDLGSLALPLGAADARAAWLAAGAAVLAGFGLRGALAEPVVREVRVAIDGLPAGLEGLRVIQISDLHIGPTIRAARVARVVDAVLAAKPDLIAVTGDMNDGSVEALREEVAPLGRLRAPLGAYFVTGNHEYYWGAEKWLARVAELGLTPLVDENRIVERGGARLLIGGIADSHARHFVPAHRSDPAAAAQGDADLKILLAHRPDACDEAEKAGFRLQLSGHTHGGQFFPFSLVVRLAHRYARGLHRHGRLALYVNPGTGFWGPPHRFAVPSEITVLTLIRA